MKYKQLKNLKNRYKWKRLNYTDALTIDTDFSGDFGERGTVDGDVPASLVS